MTPDQFERLEIAVRTVEKARRKLRKVATAIYPVGSTLTLRRGDRIISGRVVQHGEALDGVYIRDAELVGYRVTYAEIIEYQRSARK